MENKDYPIENIGKKAKVVALEDGCAEPKYLNQTGTIMELNTNGETGNTAEYPLIVIKFDDDNLESYWPCEIELID